MDLSSETLQLLQRLLDAQQLSVGDPDFDVVARAVSTAKAELRRAIELADVPSRLEPDDGR